MLVKIFQHFTYNLRITHLILSSLMKITDHNTKVQRFESLKSELVACQGGKTLRIIMFPNTAG